MVWSGMWHTPECFRGGRYPKPRGWGKFNIVEFNIVEIEKGKGKWQQKNQ